MGCRFCRIEEAPRPPEAPSPTGRKRGASALLLESSQEQARERFARRLASGVDEEKGPEWGKTKA